MSIVTQLFGTLALWLMLVLALSQLASWYWPMLLQNTLSGTPGQRSLLYLVYGLMAPVAAAFTTLLVMVPDWSMVLVPSHCHGIDCSGHQPAVDLASPVGSALAAASVLVLALLAVIAVGTLRRARRLFGTLAQVSRPSRSPNYAVVDSDALIAWCIGLLSPRVFISRGLEEALSATELSVVLAHEDAHRRRHDNLRQLLLRWATVTWLPEHRRDFLREASATAEQACDAAAATIDGPSAVVRLLERLQNQTSPAVTQSHVPFGPDELQSRIDALIEYRSRISPLRGAKIGILLAWMTIPACLTGPGHLILESLAG